MRSLARIARGIVCRPSIPLFAGKPCSQFKLLHWSNLPATMLPSLLTPFVPLDRRSAGAYSEGQGRPTAGASRAPLTAASTLAGWRRSGESGPARCTFLLLAGLLACVSSIAVSAQAQPIQRKAFADPHTAVIAEASRRFDIPAAWIRAVMHAESAGDPHAISSAGAMGLMQIMPGTWADLRVRHRLGRDPYDPRDNILAGAAYLHELYDRYGSPGFLAAYNAGPDRYEAWLKGRPLPPETRAYVAAVAPIIFGGGTASPIMVAAVDPLAWTRAQLFVVQPDRTSAVDAVQSGRSLDGGATVASLRDVSAIMPRSDGLFVTGPGLGSRP